jgi:hypothetical protein
MIKKLHYCFGATFLASLICLTNSARAQSWNLTGAPGADWYSVQLSANGAGILALSQAGSLFISTNAGASFTLISWGSGPNWYEVAGSADLSKLVGVNSDFSHIYTSTNYGATWSTNNIATLQTGGSQTWQNVASSADGNVLIALATYEYAVPNNPGTGQYSYGGFGIGTGGFFNGFGVGEYIKNDPKTRGKGGGGPTPDGGGSSEIGAIDAGGLFFGGYNYDAFTVYSAEYGFIFGGYSYTGGVFAPGTSVSGSLIYTSTNGGLNWNQSGGSPDDLYSLALSADGSTFVVGGTSSMNTASSSLGTVVTQPPIPGQWVADAISADGAKLIGAATGGPIFTSTNAGVEWSTNNAPDDTWTTVACSADGSIMVAAGSDGRNYFSSTSGLSWTSLGSLAVGTSHGISMSADGNELVAINGNSIYMMQNTNSPLLEIHPSSENVGLSWLIPSMNFSLQQSADLRSWSNAPVQPTLNSSNLHYGVTLPLATTGSLFYRLAH